MSDDRLYIEHILECIRWIEEYTSGGSDAFLRSTLIQDAVIRNLLTLAESSKRLSDGLRAAAAEVPWQQVAGFRNLVVHAYLRVDLTRGPRSTARPPPRSWPAATRRRYTG